MPERVSILGIPIDNLHQPELVTRVKALLATPGWHLCTTPNPEFLVVARRNRAFAETLRLADLSVGDGVGLQYAAFLQGKKLRRITGTQLLHTILAQATMSKSRVVILGKNDAQAQQAAEALRHKIQGATIVGAWGGGRVDSDGTWQAPELAKKIVDANPDVLIIGFGSPKQELWLRRYGPTLGARLGLGVGGAFDFLAGTVRRAPRWMQALGLEWLFRLIQQPWRWRRILNAVLIFPFLYCKDEIYSKFSNHS